MGLLRCHSWRGNVRELQNVLEAVQLLCDGDTITSGDLADHLHAKTGEHSKPLGDHPDDLQRLRAALSETNGDKTAAAKMLGWSRMRVYRAIRRTGLSMSFGKQ